MRWDNKTDQMIRDGIANRMSAREIGDILGVSRNSVIGRAHRIGLSINRIVRAPRKRSENPVKKQGIRPTTIWPKFLCDQVTDLPAEDINTNVKIMELTGLTCRFPVGGERSDTLFCGAMVFDSHPYCARHCRIAYRKNAA
jgi:GcrA cell cycle regulator